MIHEILERSIFQIIVQTPSRDLFQDFVKFLARDRLIDEPFASAESAKVPIAVLEFRRNAVLP